LAVVFVERFGKSTMTKSSAEDRPVGGAPDARRVGDHAHVVAHEDARHLAVGARAHDHHRVG
jgi:hypothetical protein